MTHINGHSLASFITILFQNHSKLAKIINKVFIYVILTIFCVNVVSGVIHAFNTDFSRLTEKADSTVEMLYNS